MSEDTEEHLVLAKGKVIMRSKDETRGVCLQFIDEFTKDNNDPNIRLDIIEEFQKETFW